MIALTVAGGCFWCIDAVFRRLKGVSSSVCGYTGGTKEDATYYRVASRQTGHAESVQVTFDETIIPADTLLDIFFLIHNPTTLNRQGNDEGPEYRSAVFYTDDSQKLLFERAIARAQETWADPIVTEVAPLDVFYEAEPEHQDYFNNNPGNGYCSIVIEPKIVKARHAYSEWFKA